MERCVAVRAAVPMVSRAVRSPIENPPGPFAPGVPFLQCWEVVVGKGARNRKLRQQVRLIYPQSAKSVSRKLRRRK